MTKVTPEEVIKRKRRHSSFAAVGPKLHIPVPDISNRLTKLRAKNKAKFQATENALTNARDKQTLHRNVVGHFKIRRISQVDPTKLRRRVLTTYHPRTLIKPTNSVYRLWQMVTMVLVLYQSFALPFNLAFGVAGTSMAEYIIDIMFGVDLVLNFNVAVSTADDISHLIIDRKDIAWIYVKGWFTIDLLSVLPFDYMFLVIYGSETDNLQALGLLKGLRLPRLIRLVKLLRLFKVLRINPELKRWMQYSRHANLLRLFRLIVIFLAITHFTACIFRGLVVHDEWLDLHTQNDNTWHQYWLTYYTSLLLIMGEDIQPIDDSELIFSSLALLFGSVMMAIVFGNVAVLVANFSAKTSMHQKKVSSFIFSRKIQKYSFVL